MQPRTILLAALACVLCLAPLAPAQSKVDIQKLWVYLPTNLLVDKNVQADIALLQRAAKAGYNGVLLTDSKFARLDAMPPKYFDHLRQVRQACRDNKMECVAAVCPMGYSEGILCHDANLAEGLPVVDAPFLVRGGKLVPADDSAQLVNGGFEQFKGDKPAGWGFIDGPGKISFADSAVKFEGRSSLRMQDIGTGDPQHGHGRVYQKIAVRPFRYYHVSVMVKTRDFESAGEVAVRVLTPGGRSLQHYEPAVAKTQDWKRVDVTFNSLDANEVNLYLGVWGGKGGTIWWDDARLDAGGLVNILRRDGAPVRSVSEDGRTVYVEGKDFAPLVDPRLTAANSGGLTVWHEQPSIAIPAGSQLKEGQKVLLSYCHAALVHRDQVACCMSEPKVYDLIRQEVQQVQKNVQPDGYFMSHDEIRMQGWDESCAARKLTPGQILADNVKKCTEIIRQADPGKKIYVWSDMFDPTHNAAKTGPYYLVKGDGPWYGSWEGLDKDVIVCNWHGHEQGRVESLKHFADRGNQQMLAGYYDGPVGRIGPWLTDAAKVPGVIGVMYTTWRHNYDDLEKFAAEVKK